MINIYLEYTRCDRCQTRLGVYGVSRSRFPLVLCGFCSKGFPPVEKKRYFSCHEWAVYK